MAQNSWFMIKLAWQSKEKKVIFLGGLSVLLAVALNLINLYITPTILAAIESHAPVAQLILTIGGFVLGSMLVSAMTGYIEANVIYGRISIRTEVIKLLNHKAATTSYPNISDDGFHSLLAKSTESVNGNNAATEAIWNTLTMLATNILGFIVYLVLFGAVQPILILVILATTVVGYFINIRLNDYEYRHKEEAAAPIRHINYISGQVQETRVAKDIRLFGLRPWLTALYDKAMSTYTAFHRKAQSVYIWGKIADLVFAFLRNGLAYVYLIGLVIRNDLDISTFLLLFTAAGGFTEWIVGILDGFNTLYKHSQNISIIRDCLEYSEPFTFEGGTPIAPEKGKDYQIELQDVSFRYPGAECDTLSHINITLHAGEKLAVVGLNGAGKTTLIKLICGFLDPASGQVLLNGQDIRTYNRADYYTLFSAVFQSFSLLAGTIATNVAQDDDNIDMERVKECVQKAGLHDKIESLPDTYHTYLNREVYDNAIMLSGGETQRLMLARALYKDAPFIILDEPTAALDPIAEADIYQKYNELTFGRSSVYISHRLASTRFCDRIIMLADAGICEEGTHDQLLQQQGKYAELYEVQSRYYKEGGASHEDQD